MFTLTRVRQRARRTTDALSALAFTLAVPVVLAMALFAKEGGGADDVPALNPFITRSQEARKVLKEARDALIAKVEGEKRSDLSEEEDKEFRRLTAEIKAHDERITELLDAEKRERGAADLAGSLTAAGYGANGVRSEPLTYKREDRSTSYFKDLGLAYVGGDQEARERLSRHRDEMHVELPKREARMEREFRAGLESLKVGDRAAAIERRDISRVDGAGGEFVPPLWLMDLYAGLPRAGRPFLELVRNIPLPAGTDSINIPRITTGTAVAAQTADNAAVQETDMVTNSVAAPVRTIAGQQDVALQLLEQSPIVFDELIFMDLRADYNAKADIQGLNGSGSSGQLQGILGLAGTTPITYTDASPTVQELFPKGADALSQASTARKRVPNVWVMAPRRWFWMTSQLDANGRPLVVSTAQNGLNTIAEIRDTAFEGPVGTWHGLPVVLDPNMPITLGTGAEDNPFATLSTDHVLFEGVERTRALPEVLSGNLTVRLQLYRYIAFTAGRYPSATAIISGTGVTTPTF